MKISEIQELSEEEAQNKIAELRAELSKERASIASGTRPEKPAKMKNIRRTIARILTAQREKEIKSAWEKRQKKKGKEKKNNEKKKTKGEEK